MFTKYYHIILYIMSLPLKLIILMLLYTVQLWRCTHYIYIHRRPGELGAESLHFLHCLLTNYCGIRCRLFRSAQKEIRYLSLTKVDFPLSEIELYKYENTMLTNIHHSFNFIHNLKRLHRKHKATTKFFCIIKCQSSMKYK